MVSQRPFQSLHPLSLLAQLISRHASGCLTVLSGSTRWSICLDDGHLVYATNSLAPFDRLDRHLHHLHRQIPALVSAVRMQVRVLFEPTEPIADYRAIRWLVDQGYLNSSQATLLVQDLAKEVIEPFLSVNEGHYEVLDKDHFDDFPNLCQLDLRSIVEQCQDQLRRRVRPITPHIPLDPTSRSVQRLQELSRYGNHGTATLSSPSDPSLGGRDTTPTAMKTRYTIACIDDSPTILQAINAFLEDSSFAVIMIGDPVKALMQIVRSKPDLILLDVGMPNLDGYELCSLLRRHPNFKQTPIIMVTGLTGFIDRAKAKLVGASGYLTKPFTQSELLKTIFKHLT